MDKEMKIVNGKELTKQQLEVINSVRKREFNSSSIIYPKPDNDDWNKVYFLLLDKMNNTPLAFARLHNVKVTVNKNVFNVLGIATLVAVEKGKGYGTTVIKEMADYCKKENAIGLGFCNPNLSEFYKDRGFSILKRGGERFLFKNNEGEIVPSRFGINDVIYLPKENVLMNEIISDPNCVAYLSRAQW